MLDRDVPREEKVAYLAKELSIPKPEADILLANMDGDLDA